MRLDGDLSSPSPESLLAPVLHPSLPPNDLRDHWEQRPKFQTLCTFPGAPPPLSMAQQWKGQLDSVEELNGDTVPRP